MKKTDCVDLIVKDRKTVIIENVPLTFRQRLKILFSLKNVNFTFKSKNNIKWDLQGD